MYPVHVHTGLCNAFVWTQIYTTHTHQLPTMHNTFVHTVHTNVCVMETCIDIYKQCARHMLHINKYTIHAQKHRVHTQWARQAQRYTPFTFMHIHAYSHVIYTSCGTHVYPGPRNKSTHGSVFPFLLSSHPPTLSLFLFSRYL